MKIRLAALAVVTALVVGLSYIGFGDRADAGGTGTATRASAAAVDSGGAPSSEHELARLINAFEVDVHRTPNSTGLSFLGGLYLQRARLTGDLGSYDQAGTAIDAALAMAPDDAETLGRKASYLYRTHDFSGARDLASRISAADPTALGALAVLGDAQVELGHDADAQTTYDRLAAAAPSTPSVDVRRSHLLYLEGDIRGAERLALQAEHEAVASGEFGVGLAYYREARAGIRFDQGDYDGAATLYEAALHDAPGYYATTALLAKTRAAQGRTDDAVRLYRQAIAHVPQPDYLAGLGDQLARRGDRRGAEEQYRTVELTGTLAAINRQVYNRLLVIFDADHGRNVADAVRLAQNELTVRKDAFGYDAAAWALFAAGRYGEARADADRALSFHVPDARIAYHAGMIAKAQGDTVTARRLLREALDRSPHFDVLQAPRARAALSALGNRG